MFHLVTTTFRALCDQQPTQIGYVSDEESLIHPDALSQIAAATKQLAASSLEERRTIDRAFEGLSAVAGRQLCFNLQCALRVGQSGSNKEFDAASRKIPQASAAIAPRLCANTNVSLTLAMALPDCTLPPPFRRFTPIQSAARSLQLLSPIILGSGLQGLVALETHLGSSWTRVVLPRLVTATSSCPFRVGCSTWASTSPLVSLDDIASIGSDSTPTTPLAIFLLHDIIATAAGPCVTTLPWNALDILLMNDEQASYRVLDRCFRQPHARFVLVPYHNGEATAHLCYDCQLNTVHVYNSAPQSLQPEAVKAVALACGHAFRLYLELEYDPAVKEAQTWKQRLGADSALVTLSAWLEDFGRHSRGEQSGLSTACVDMELLADTYNDLCQNMMLLAQHACEAEIISLTYKLSIADGIPPLARLRQALNAAIGRPLVGDIFKLGHQLLALEPHPSERSWPAVSFPINTVCHPMNTGTSVLVNEPLDAWLCTDHMDTALQAMAIWADGVLAASCNGMLMAQAHDPVVAPLTSQELCLYLFGEDTVDLNGTPVVLFPVLADQHFFLVALTRASSDERHCYIFDSLGMRSEIKERHIRALVWIHQAIALINDSKPKYSPPAIFSDAALQDDGHSCGYFVLHFARIIIENEIKRADWLSEYMLQSVDVKIVNSTPRDVLWAILGGKVTLSTFMLTAKNRSPFFLTERYSLDNFKQSVLWAVHQHNELLPASLQLYSRSQDTDVATDCQQRMMDELPPKHPKRYGGSRGQRVRDYESNGYRTNESRSRSKRPQRATTDAKPSMSSKPGSGAPIPLSPMQQERECEYVHASCEPDEAQEDPLLAETAFPTRDGKKALGYNCLACGMTNLSMMELSAHYNLNEVQEAACRELVPSTQHFASLLGAEFELDLVDGQLQQQALEYIGDLLGIEPLQRTASCLCELVTKALHIDESVYNEFPSGMPSVPTTDFKRFPGCHDRVSVRDHELVFCSEEVARLGPMSNISSLVHLSTTLAKMAVQDALAELGQAQSSTTGTDADPQPRVYPSALSLPEYFKLFWSCSACGFLDLLGPKTAPGKCRTGSCPRRGDTLDSRVFVQDFVKHISRLRQRTMVDKDQKFQNISTPPGAGSLSDLTETKYFQALVARYGADAAYAQFYVDGVNPYSGQRNRDTVEIGTLTFANFDLNSRTNPGNTHTLFVAEGGIKMNGLQALFSLMLRRSLPFPDKELPYSQQPVILTHVLGDLPALAAFMGHAGHSHKCGCPICDIQADSASSLDKDVKHHTQTFAFVYRTFARRLQEQGRPRNEKDLRAATHVYKAQQRVRTVANVKSALETLSLPRNRPKPLPPRPLRRGTHDPLYDVQEPSNLSGSFQAACPLLCLEYTQLAHISKSIDLLHNNYLGVASRYLQQHVGPQLAPKGQHVAKKASNRVEQGILTMNDGSFSPWHGDTLNRGYFSKSAYGKKASQHRSFMLEYGPGVLFQAGFRGKRHSHFMLLSLAMAFWSQPTATSSSLAYADVCYQLWLKEIHTFHPEGKEYIVIPINFHMATHISSTIAKLGPPIATWCFGAERWYNAYHRIPKGGRGGAVATLARWHTSMQAFQYIASGQLAPDCHPSLLGPLGLIARAIGPSSYAQSLYESEVMGSLSGEEPTPWQSYGAAHRGSGGILAQCSPLVTHYLVEQKLVLQREVVEMVLTVYQRMRVEGVPYSTLPDSDWTVDQLLSSRALIVLKGAERPVYAVAVTYVELRLRTLPVECLVVYRALAANGAATTCHRPTGFACINTAPLLAGTLEVARVGDIMGPVVGHKVYAKHPNMCALQLLAPRRTLRPAR